MYDVIIIGAGCAGITAAIYSKRSGMKTLLIEKDTPGGVINKSSVIENYPGYTKIDGPSFAFNLFKQINDLKIELKMETVNNIGVLNNKKIVVTDKNKYDTKNVIIAVGRMPKKLNIPNEKKLIGKGISNCAICDGNLYKDKVVAIIGGGNSALEESLYLSEIARKVIIINRSNILRGDNSLQNKIENKENIEVLYDKKINKFIGDDKLRSISISTNNSRDIENINVDGAFIFIGYESSTSFIKDLGITDDKGYIITDKNQETKINGIYACGDVIKKDLYQIVTATSEGAIAATHIKKHVD